MNNQLILYKNEKYEELINIYNDDLTNKNLFNRCLCYLKLTQFNNAFNDAIKLVENNETSFKAWGYLGASLYGLNKLEQSIVAYNKASDLFINENKSSTNENIYKKMVDEFINTKKNLKKDDIINDKISENIHNPNVKGLFNSLYNAILSDPTVINKLNNAEFQTKLLSLHNKPAEALKDDEISGILNDLIKNMSF